MHVYAVILPKNKSRGWKSLEIPFKKHESGNVFYYTINIEILRCVVNCNFWCVCVAFVCVCVFVFIHTLESKQPWPWPDGRQTSSINANVFQITASQCLTCHLNQTSLAWNGHAQCFINSLTPKYSSLIQVSLPTHFSHYMCCRQGGIQAGEWGNASRRKEWFWNGAQLNCSHMMSKSESRLKSSIIILSFPDSIC